jgi:uncharacterized membrane protein YdjX (TVP38/TMEM64 family)
MRRPTQGQRRRRAWQGLGKAARLGRAEPLTRLSHYARHMDSGGAEGTGATRRTALRRIVSYGAVLALVFGVTVATGSLPSPNEVRDWVEGLGGLAYVAFVPLFVVANFVITWSILAGAAGLLFGTAAGTPLALAGVTLAALTQMFVARRLAAGHHGSLLPARTRPIEDFLTRHGAVAVLESRIVPLLPYGLVNFSAGLTLLRFRDMAAGTLVGAAPKVFAYVALGGSLSNLRSPEAIVAILLLAALAVAGGLFVRRQIAMRGA